MTTGKLGQEGQRSRKVTGEGREGERERKRRSEGRGGKIRKKGGKRQKEEQGE